MRPKFTTAAVMFVAVLAMGAVGVAAASAALPEFSKTKVAFASTSGTSVLEVSDFSITCTSSTSAGKIENAKELSDTITFTGCIGPLKQACNSEGATSGVIKSKLLTGTLGYLDKAGKEVGELLKPAEGTNFFTIDCQGEEGETTGGVIGKIANVNEKSTKSTLAFATVGGKQEFTKFEGGSTYSLTTFGKEATLKGTDAITMAEAVEIKA